MRGGLTRRDTEPKGVAAQLRASDDGTAVVQADPEHGQGGVSYEVSTPHDSISIEYPGLGIHWDGLLRWAGLEEKNGTPSANARDAPFSLVVDAEA